MFSFSYKKCNSLLELPEEYIIQQNFSELNLINILQVELVLILAYLFI